MLDISFRSFAKKPVFWDSGPKFLSRCVNLKIFFYVFQASKVPRQPLKGSHLEKCEKNSKSLHLNAQSIFKEVFFSSLGQKNFFSVELLRPLVSVNNDFLKFFIFEVPKKLFKNFTSLRVGSGLYAYPEHMRQELMRKLSIRSRNWCAY